MDAMTAPTGEAAIEIRTEADGWWTNTPWWLVSAGVHLVILLVATLVTIERIMATESTGIILETTAASPGSPIQELERDVEGFKRRLLPGEVETQKSVEAPIFFPGAEISDHNESANNQDFAQMLGDSKDFESYLPGKAGGFRGRQNGMDPGVYDVMG